MLEQLNDTKYNTEKLCIQLAAKYGTVIYARWLDVMKKKQHHIPKLHLIFPLFSHIPNQIPYTEQLNYAAEALRCAFIGLEIAGIAHTLRSPFVEIEFYATKK